MNIVVQMELTTRLDQLMRAVVRLHVMNHGGLCNLNFIHILRLKYLNFIFPRVPSIIFGVGFCVCIIVAIILLICCCAKNGNQSKH